MSTETSEIAKGHRGLAYDSTEVRNVYISSISKHSAFTFL
jgi:hypothetical protein